MRAYAFLLMGYFLIVPSQGASQSIRPQIDFRLHYLGDMFLLVSNNGWFGVGHGRDIEVESADHEALGINWTPSLEYPRLSRIGYLDVGRLAVGGIRGYDTLVSTDFILGGSFGEWHSMSPIVASSSLRGSPNFHADALGEQHYYAVCNDTIRDPNADSYLDFIDRRPHRPLGVELHISSVASGTGGLQRSVIVDVWAINIGDEAITQACIGFWFSSGVFSDEYESEFGRLPDLDDIGGIVRSIPSSHSGRPDTVNLVWIADNDGDPYGSTFGRASPRAAMGVLPLRGPEGGRFQFNWWGMYGTEPNLRAWGPYTGRNSGRYVDATGSTRANGRPGGDRSAYFVMTNGEVDYPQTRAGISHVDAGWGPPLASPQDKDDITNGARIYNCLSYGPVSSIAPGDSIPFSLAILVGDQFHSSATHFSRTFDAEAPHDFENGLGFADLVHSALTTRFHFDNPGVDTDGDGFRGTYELTNCGVQATDVCDTVWISGDGVPDWGGATPPPPPVMSVETVPHKVTIRWSGSVSELTDDPITRRNDFEGYRVYSARLNAPEGYALIASWDIPDNYYRLAYDASNGRWARISYPLSLYEWRQLLGEGFNPASYSSPSLANAYRDITVDTIRSVDGEIVRILERERLSYWAPEGPNLGNEQVEMGVVTANLIQRIDTRDTLIGDALRTYGVYEFSIERLNASIPLYFAVTAFDHGDYRQKIEAQESSTSSNNMSVFPVYSSDVVEDSGLRVTVYPNPYKYSFPDGQGNVATYFGQGFEGYGQTHLREQDRRIWFANLPDTATIRIYSLDGDLIREIHHPDQFLTRYSSVVGWDLVTRNTQAVVSGIYIWRVDSRLGSQVGKLVIIK